MAAASAAIAYAFFDWCVGLGVRGVGSVGGLTPQREVCGVCILVLVGFCGGSGAGVGGVGFGSASSGVVVVRVGFVASVGAATV